MSKNILIQYGQPFMIILGFIYYMRGYNKNVNLNKENHKLKEDNKLLENKICKLKTIKQNIEDNILQFQKLIEE